MKRLRKAVGPVRFYMCGEYGDDLGRPHFHCCLFNHSFSDEKPLFRTGSGSVVSSSAQLSALWGLGHSSIGQVTFESAAYVARYCVAKVTGRRAQEHYERIDPETGEIYQLVPEFNRMSLKPGIGAAWFDKFSSDVYPHDYLVLRGGRKSRPPRYYDRLYARKEPVLIELVKLSREILGRENAHDNTPERRLVKEAVTEAAFKAYHRDQI